MINYGETLREWRIAQGYTSRERFARAIGLSVFTVQEWETGRTKQPRDIYRQRVVEFARERGVEPPEGWALPK